MPNIGTIEELKINKTKIFCKLKERIKDINKYFSIKRTFENGKSENNAEFIKTYKGFYKMRFLKEPFLKKYFKLLEDKEVSLEKILNKLKYENSKGNNVLQFSFTTKLLHTINNDKPIYDKHIGEIFGTFGIQLNDRGLKLSDRIKNRRNYYKKLEKEFEKLSDHETVKELIKNCRRKFKCEEYDWSEKCIVDLKVLDFMLWANNQIK